MELLFAPFVAFVAVPLLALLPALGLGARRRRLTGEVGALRRHLTTAGVAAWLVYTVYECGVWIWSQSVIAPIRIDLFVIAPFLYLLSAIALAASRKPAAA